MIDFHGDDDRLDFTIGDSIDFEPAVDIHEDGLDGLAIGRRGPPADVPRGIGVERHDVPGGGRGRGRGLTIWDWERRRGRGRGGERDDHPGRGRGLTLHPRDDDDKPGRGRGR